MLITIFSLQAVVALAGFYVGEAYCVPWAEVPVPDVLQLEIFPFVEEELSYLRTSDSKINQGTVNFLELLQLLRPFVWRVSAFHFLSQICLPRIWIQVLASLHHEFPDCIILQGLRITHSPAAKSFFSQWLELRKAAEKAFERDREIASTFHEASTQSAFMSISARQRDLEDAMRRQSAHLQVIARRTEPLSPTRKQKVAPTPLSVSPPSTPSHLHPSPSSAALFPSIELSCPTSAVAPLLNGSGRIPSPPAVAVVTSSSETIPQMLVPHAATVLPHPSGPSPCASEQPSVHMPILVMIGSERFHVLPLSPPPIRTSFDLILPPPAAFHHPSHPSTTFSPPFPTFDTAHCTWQAIFKMILQPSLLWDCWSPKAIGAYPDVKSLWVVWQEGALIEGVGRAPPLQLVEAEWGHHKDKRTGKGRLPAWRPRKDEKVSTVIVLCTSISF